jgi:hypothetical protein
LDDFAQPPAGPADTGSTMTGLTFALSFRFHVATLEALAYYLEIREYVAVVSA